MIGKAILAAFFFSLVLAAAPVPKEPPEPEWMAAFHKAYELKDDEYVKRVPKPWIPERIDFDLRSYGPPNKDAEIEKANRESFKKYED